MSWMKTQFCTVSANFRSPLKMKPCNSFHFASKLWPVKAGKALSSFVSKFGLDSSSFVRVLHKVQAFLSAALSRML